MNKNFWSIRIAKYFSHKTLINDIHIKWPNKRNGNSKILFSLALQRLLSFNMKGWVDGQAKTSGEYSSSDIYLPYETLSTMNSEKYCKCTLHKSCGTGFTGWG